MSPNGETMKVNVEDLVASRMPDEAPTQDVPVEATKRFSAYLLGPNAFEISKFILEIENINRSLIEYLRTTTIFLRESLVGNLSLITASLEFHKIDVNSLDPLHSIFVKFIYSCRKSNASPESVYEQSEITIHELTGLFAENEILEGEFNYYFALINLIARAFNMSTMASA